MKLLYFDTETTGLIPKGASYENDFAIFPSIVQMSWYFNGRYNDYIIKPEGWQIPEESTKIHGISQTKAEKYGNLLGYVLSSFLIDCTEADHIVAFNIYFDTSIIKAATINMFGLNSEVYQYMSNAIDKSKRIDLMYKSIKIVNARKENGSSKFPTLKELYFKLFEETFPSHNALEDVKALKRCYEQLI